MQISSNDLSNLGLFSGAVPAPAEVVGTHSPLGDPVRWLLIGAQTHALLESLVIQLAKEYRNPLILAGLPALSDSAQREILKYARRNKGTSPISSTLRAALLLPSLALSSLVLAGNNVPDVVARGMLAAIPASGAPRTAEHLAGFDKVILGPAANWQEAAILAEIAAQWHTPVSAAFFLTLRPGYGLALQGKPPHRYTQIIEAITGNVPKFID